MDNKKKIVKVLAVVHLGNYDESGKIVDDSCPCCERDPSQYTDSEKSQTDGDDPEWVLGMIWDPAVERGIGAYHQVFHYQSCGLVYATHVN